MIESSITQQIEEGSEDEAAYFYDCSFDKQKEPDANQKEVEEKENVGRQRQPALVLDETRKLKPTTVQSIAKAQHKERKQLLNRYSRGGQRQYREYVNQVAGIPRFKHQLGQNDRNVQANARYNSLQKINEDDRNQVIR